MLALLAAAAAVLGFAELPMPAVDWSDPEADVSRLRAQLERDRPADPPRGSGTTLVTAQRRGGHGVKRRATPRSLRGTGELAVVRRSPRRAGAGPMKLFAVEVERGLRVDRDAFVRQVERALFDRRGWARRGGFALRRTEVVERAALTVTLASPETTNRLCAPLQTNGIFSCNKGSRAVLNARRWRDGATAFAGDLVSYRRYLVNHEVGHVLGRGHRGCLAPGAPAPVMMQQTKGVGPCKANPWPLDAEA